MPTKKSKKQQVTNGMKSVVTYVRKNPKKILGLAGVVASVIFPGQATAILAIATKALELFQP